MTSLIKMTKTTNREIRITIFTLIILSLIVFSAFTNGYKRGYQKATENLIQRLDKCEADFEILKEEHNLMYKLQHERCVCVGWQSSDNEPPMTKDEICNYPMKMYEFNPKYGYSTIDYWEKEPSY
jgi:hypothetical protein